MKVSVCIPTHRREELLRVLLEDLALQERQPDEIVVVDNEAGGSARAVVEAARAGGYPIPLVYAIQPERSIPLTRNMTVALASGDWLAFIDDDERAPREWLRLLMECAATHSADGVLAPVIPLLPPSAPDWMRRGGFYDWPRTTTGTVVPRKLLRFGNLLLRGASVRRLRGPFDPQFALSAGEDVDMLVRFVADGARLVWCDEAIVTEPVAPQRLSQRWLLMRSFSGGQAFGLISLAGTLGRVSATRRLLLLGQWSAQLVTALLIAIIVRPLGKHRHTAWLIKAWANAGKLTAFRGRRYSAYA